jgi:type I restriction-modification system DNA methylase subunit
MGKYMFEQAFRNIDDVLRKEAGCTTELDYTEQTSWLLFLKYLDGLEQDKAAEAQLEGKTHTYILDKPYRWESWAAPKGKDGKLDHNTAMTGDDLRDFVNQKLFPYLHGFTQKASGPNTIEYKIGQIFAEIRNKISSGYNLREIIDHIDELRFRSQTEKHELSHLYEAKIKHMGIAVRNGGEYYTPRPLVFPLPGGKSLVARLPPPWQRRTNVCRKVTNPARAPTRLRSGGSVHERLSTRAVRARGCDESETPQTGGGHLPSCTGVGGQRSRAQVHPGWPSCRLDRRGHRR